MHAVRARFGHLRLPSKRRLAALAVAAAAVAAAPPTASAADRTATPSTFASVFAAAQGGDTILLASGDYGRFTGGAKSSMVTVKPQSGATATVRPDFNGASNVTLDGLTIPGLGIGGSATKHITVRNSRFTGQAYVNMAGNANADILFQGNRFEPWNVNGGAEGRLHVTQPGALGSAPVGVTVSKNTFQGPGCSDGMQIGAYGVVVKDNLFTGIRQGSCGAHVDSIQLYGQSHTTITGNHFRDFSVAIMAPDGGNHEIVTDNVIDQGPNAGGSAVQFGSFRNGSLFAHNTVRGTDVMVGSRDIRLRDNVMVDGSFWTGGCNEAGDVCAVERNLFNSAGRAVGSGAIVGTPVWVGGASPTGYAGFALASGSPGKGRATDGTDLGVNPGGTVTAPAPKPTPTPTPSPTPTPAPADQPAKARWTPPSNARTGVPATLDATRSTGDGRLTCTWTFENERRSIIWETATGCKITKTFANADTKYVTLKVRDADGDVAYNRRSFTVTRGG